MLSQPSCAPSSFTIKAFSLINLLHVLRVCFLDDLVTQLHQRQRSIHNVKKHNTRSRRDVKKSSIPITSYYKARMKEACPRSIVSMQYKNTRSTLSVISCCLGILGQEASSFLDIGTGVPICNFWK